jgi:hypothetical protein
MAASSLPDYAYDKDRQRRVRKNCAQCGVEFMARTHPKKPNLCCSIRCGQLHRRRYRRTIPCPRCGAEFWPWKSGKHPRKYCSRKCIATPKRPNPGHPCLWCEAATTRPKFCSAQCAKRATCARKHMRRRGMRRRQEIIPLPEIYARDRGICGLCHRKVNGRFIAPDPRSATLDHIVPLKAGGQHVRANVQLAHYACNSAKGTRACGSQLRLY